LRGGDTKTMNKPEKFYQLYLANKLTLDDIDDYIEQWHTGDSKEEIYEFLGMSQDIYGLWVDSCHLQRFTNIILNGGE